MGEGKQRTDWQLGRIQGGSHKREGAWLHQLVLKKWPEVHIHELSPYLCTTITKQHPSSYLIPLSLSQLHWGSSLLLSPHPADLSYLL